MMYQFCCLSFGVDNDITDLSGETSVIFVYDLFKCKMRQLAKSKVH